MHFHKLLFIFTLLFSQLIFSQETINEGQSAVLNNPNNNVGPDQSDRLRAISIVNDVEENKKFKYVSKWNYLFISFAHTTARRLETLLKDFLIFTYKYI